MAADRNDDLKKFVEQQVQAGSYRSADEVVKAGLHLLRDRESQLEALRAALIEGEQSGPATAFDFENYISGKCRRQPYRVGTGTAPR